MSLQSETGAFARNRLRKLSTAGSCTFARTANRLLRHKSMQW